MKTQTMFKSIFGTAFITLLLLMASCDAADNPSALVGRWVGVSGGDKGFVIELLSDGTGILSNGSEGRAITWKTEKDRFYITASGVASAASYKLQDSVLTLTGDNGKISEHTKCKKDCESAAKEYVKAKFASVKKSLFTDSRDSKSYKTVKFGNQTWMAENLNYKAEGTNCADSRGGRPGKPRRKAGAGAPSKAPEALKPKAECSKCYENQESNCQKYGRLYDWNTAMKACPSGWHLPSKDEWQVLVDLAGGDRAAGNILKASSGWNSNGNGVDAIGFAALPGSSYSDGKFYDVGSYGIWWSATEYNAYNAYFLGMYNGIEGVLKHDDDKDNLQSVRCVQD